MPAILLGCNKIFGRAVNREIEGCFGGERFNAARRFGMRIFYDKIGMRLFVDVVEEWKGSGENKNANRNHCAEANDDPAHRAFG